jgi:hypothetical protein
MGITRDIYEIGKDAAAWRKEKKEVQGVIKSYAEDLPINFRR